MVKLDLDLVVVDMDNTLLGGGIMVQDQLHVNNWNTQGGGNGGSGIVIVRYQIGINNLQKLQKQLVVLLVSIW